MSEIVKRLIDTLKGYPAFLTRKHLVECGIYPSHASVIMAHRRGTAPKCVRIGGKGYRYAKTQLVDWLVENQMAQQHVLTSYGPKQLLELESVGEQLKAMLASLPTAPEAPEIDDLDEDGCGQGQETIVDPEAF